MADTSTAYKYTVDLSYIRATEEIKINTNFVKYIAIEYLYGERYMPVIFLSMAVKNEIYTKLVENEKTAKIFMHISKYNAYSNTSVNIDYIKDQFTYIVSTSNPNYSQVLESNETAENSYKVITLALMSMEILNIVKTTYNGIFNHIDSDTIIINTLAGRPTVVKPPKYNPTFGTIIIPSVNSKEKMLSFLFEQCPFYDTEYMFFNDFDRSYLLDWTGEYVDGKDGDLHTIYFDIRDLTDSAAYAEGMSINNGAYYIYVNPAKTNITLNKGLDKVSNSVIYIDDDGNTTYMDLNINNNADSTPKYTIKRGINATLEKNMLEMNTIFIDIIKNDIDMSKITPNKQYIIKNYEDYAEYNGKYTLFYKREILKITNGEFRGSTNIGLRKVGNIQNIGLGVVQATMERYRSAVARHVTTTTANSTVTSSDSRTNRSIPGNITTGGGSAASRRNNNGGRAMTENEILRARLAVCSPTSKVLPFKKIVKNSDPESIRNHPIKIV